MSIFGSQEDDPLLQGDPFAPSSGDGAPEENGAANDDPTNESASDSGSPSGRPARENQPSTASDDSGEGSVFTPSTGTHRPLSGESSKEEEASREIVRTAEQAASGDLATLNDALSAGWQLRCVELRTAAAADPSHPDGTRSFAFILGRSTP